MTTRYLMDAPGEGDRLEAKTNRLALLEHLDRLGPHRGMRVLDAGGGTGAVGRSLAQRVGEDGEVVVLDVSAARLRQGEDLARIEGVPNLRFVHGDLTAPPEPAEGFDYVWCRFVFEYLADPALVLDNLRRYARIGGKVVVGDLDGNGVVQYPPDPEVEAGIALMLRCLEGRFDPWMGRKLVALYHRAELQIDAVHVFPYHVYAGSMPARDEVNWRQKFAALRPLCADAFGGTSPYDRFVERYLSHVRTSGTLTYSTLIYVEGTRVA